MSRDLESIRFEADYWQAVLNDTLELNQHVADVAQALAVVPVALLRMLVAAQPDGAHEEASRAVSSAMTGLATMQGPIMRLIELADGRYKAMVGEAGLES